jgi:hypothetical protein
MTYREAIQKLQRDSNTLYEKCGALRDHASPEEKKYWNNLRGLLDNVYREFGSLDNAISNGQASMQIEGNY